MPNRPISWITPAVSIIGLAVALFAGAYSRDRDIEHRVSILEEQNRIVMQQYSVMVSQQREIIERLTRVEANTRRVDKREERRYERGY